MAKTFNISPRSKEPKETGTAFKIVVRLCGLIAIGGFFLPYLNQLSGLDLAQGIGESISNKGFGDTMSGLFGATSTPGSIVNFLIIIAYIVFPLIGLMMLSRGRYTGGPFTFLLLFNIAAWVMVNFFGADAGIDTNFFMLTGPGYWVSCGGLFLPFIAMFFLDKSI